MKKPQLPTKDLFRKVSPTTKNQLTKIESVKTESAKIGSPKRPTVKKPPLEQRIRTKIQQRLSNLETISNEHMSPDSSVINGTDYYQYNNRIYSK